MLTKKIVKNHGNASVFAAQKWHMGMILGMAPGKAVGWSSSTIELAIGVLFTSFQVYHIPVPPKPETFSGFESP